MSRRDTIIIAVLVNAALLVVLFVTAIRSGKEERSSSFEKPAQLAEKAVNNPHSQEELLNQFITPMPTLAEATLSDESGISEILVPEEIPLAFTLGDANPLPEEISSITQQEPSIKEEVTPALSFVNVTVKKGDFLEKIAKANSTSVSAIMKANNLASTQLKIGQVLKIPMSGSKKASDKPAVRPAAPVLAPSATLDAEYYVVKDGDNPWLIATRNHLKLEELLRLNHLDEQKAKKLRPGDKLRIR